MLVDWSRLDPDASFMELCQRFELDPLPEDRPTSTQPASSAVEELHFLSSHLVFHKLRGAFQETWSMLHGRVGFVSHKSQDAAKYPASTYARAGPGSGRQPLMPRGPVGPGTLAASLLGGFLAMQAPTTPAILKALDLANILLDDSVLTDLNPDAAGWLSNNELSSRGDQLVSKFSALYGIRELTNSSADLTKAHLGTVLGGRIGQERPATTDVKTAGMVADLDIEACYGTALKELSVPIGHPTQLYYSRSEPKEWPSLASFLDRWGDELVPGCWMAVVETAGPEWIGPRSDMQTLEGCLSFPQDFLLSKITTGKSGAPSFAEMGGRGWGYEQPEGESGSAHIQGSSRILRKEVKNGVLTSSSLALLQAAATTAEFHELLAVLRVKAATIFPKSSQEFGFLPWVKRVLADKDRCRLRTFAYRRAHGLVDTRPGAWMQVPLKPLLSPLLEARHAASGQRAKYIKLVINSLYGVLASPHFLENNPLVANHVTDMARVVLWLMTKSSNALLSVTDGCASPLNKFPLMGAGCPGLGAFTKPPNATAPLQPLDDGL